MSEKTGFGIPEVLESIVENVPSPIGNINGKLSCMIIDSSYDAYRGIIVDVRMFDGKLKVGMIIKMFSIGDTYEVLGVGYLGMNVKKTDIFLAGEVGYIFANIKNISSVRIGDTIIEYNNETFKVLPGYKEAKPFVYVGLYPINTNNFEALRITLEKLKLNDYSFYFSLRHQKLLDLDLGMGF